MARGSLNLEGLPAQTELQSFARVAAHLLAEHPTPAIGSRSIKRRAGVGMQHLDHRDYVPGDEVRHIDWRQTARRQRPIVRQFEAETTGDWFVLLDASSSMAIAGAGKWRAAVQAGCAMAYALLELGHRVALVTFGDDVLSECAPGRGAVHFPSIVRTLSSSRPAPAGARSNLASCVRRLSGTASAFVVSDFLAPSELRPDLAALRERCVVLHALQVSDPQELQVVGPGPVDLVDVETGEVASSAAGANVELLARHEHAGLSRRLRHYCLNGGIAFTRWSIDRPWQHVLVDHLVRAYGTR